MPIVLVAGGALAVLWANGTLKDLSTTTKWVAVATVVVYTAPIVKKVLK